MLATFVIGLREGLEAALIVGIVAAFLGKQGRRDMLRYVWLGVSVAVLICIGVGVGLEAVSQELPQRQQEGMETIIGLFAVVMVTFMIVWMSKHARDMKGSLEASASQALAKGSAIGLVAMAFLAVLREGFETAVFLLATLQASGSAALGAVGAALGILVSVAIGFGIFRGGLRLNMAKFFKLTGVVLVLVAAGLMMSAAHTATEAGWLVVGQQQVVDLSAVVQPGTPISSLLTGVLGIQPVPVLAEVIAWAVYLVPMMAYLLWPRRTANTAKPAATADPATAAARSGQVDAAADPAPVPVAAGRAPSSAAASASLSQANTKA